MGEHVATLIIEPRSLFREALVSLMESHSYRVVGRVTSMADIDSGLLVTDVPKVVILGAVPAATADANSIRKLWPATKIIHLFEHPIDFQTLLATEVDGSVPLSASPDMLIGTLQQIIATDCKMLVLRTAQCLSILRTTGGEAVSRSVIALPSHRLPIAPVVTSDEAQNGAFDNSLSIRVRHGLSEREEQILRDLVKGLSNKIIARKRAMAEATVKVHVKSILRKIRRANRTQAAIWAVENGYGTEDLRPELPRLEAALQPLEAPRLAR
jgi:two-component system, NarL family, nitrate/nitrite response regulator NarL